MKLLPFLAMLILGDVYASSFAYTIEAESLEYYKQDQENSLHQLTMSAEWSAPLNSHSRLFVRPRVRKSTIHGIKDESGLVEGYLDYRFPNSDLRIGQQIISWGRADIVNPIDIGRQNFIDPLDEDNEKLGQLALNYRSYQPIGTFELVWLPIYQDSRLPNLDSPWFIDLPDQSEQGQNFNYQLKSIEGPDTSLDNSQFGLRYTHSLNGWDFGASYFYGWNDVPAYDTGILNMTQDDILVSITPTPYRQEIIGIDLASVIYDISFRMEYAYLFTQDSQGIDPLVDDPYSHLVLGADTDISDLFDTYSARLLFELSQQFKTTDIEYTPQDINHIFEQTAFVRFSLEDQPTWTYQFDYAKDFANDGILIRPRFTYNFQDDLKFRISLEWLEGDERSFFGQYKDNRSIRIALVNERIGF